MFHNMCLDVNDFAEVEENILDDEDNELLANIFIGVEVQSNKGEEIFNNLFY